MFAYEPPNQVFPRAKAEAIQALALDSTLAEAHVALAHALFAFDFDWVASDREFREAIRLDPVNIYARILFAISLQDRKRVAEALAHLDTAYAIDPLSPFISAVRGRVYVNARRDTEAIPPLVKALALAPTMDVAYQQLGHAYLQQKKFPEAIEALQTAANVGSDSRLGTARLCLRSRRSA